MVDILLKMLVFWMNFMHSILIKSLVFYLLFQWAHCFWRTVVWF